ncbi:MAG TPA: LysM domain-containing protein [Casimicrobiaceae bacterium]|jgi:tetratricopeptide (TPR) repeat protein|nr:LysM domain-containing protein [Casimicrobiaceae bacterium]
MTIFSMRAAQATALAAAVLLAAGCASPPAGAPAKPEPSPPPAAAPVAAPAPPAPSPEPVPVDPAVARPQAQKLALEAVDQLQNGDEAQARTTLERALALDPANDLARKLQDQIRADAQKELGPVFFRYTVQRDDTLSKLAQQFLGDRFRFYILAKYNDIANPSRVAAGQVIRIPGKAPATPPPVPAAAAAAPEPPPPAAPVQAEKPRDEASDALAKAAQLERSGNLDGAYAAYVEVAQRYPTHAEAAKRRDASRANLVRALDREASQAFQRQNLDLAIAKWDRVLEIDPNNKKARLERERAMDLKRKIEKKFGAK